jgi:hypothetical protein
LIASDLDDVGKLFPDAQGDALSVDISLVGSADIPI